MPAFDAVAFDPTAFDTGLLGGSSHPWVTHVVKDTEEEAEMKLSQLLAQQLQEQIWINQSLMKAQIQANNNLTPVVTKVVEAIPPKPEMDPNKKAELLRRLEMARQTKEERKKLEEERSKQRLKNLAKARRVKAKNSKR